MPSIKFDFQKHCATVGKALKNGIDTNFCFSATSFSLKSEKINNNKKMPRRSDCRPVLLPRAWSWRKNKFQRTVWTPAGKRPDTFPALDGNHKCSVFHNSPSEVSKCDCSEGKFLTQSQPSDAAHSWPWTLLYLLFSATAGEMRGQWQVCQTEIKLHKIHRNSLSLSLFICLYSRF